MMKLLICAIAIFGFAGLVDSTRIARLEVQARPATQTFQILGSHANAWSAVAVGIGGTSTALDTRWAPFCSAFGNSSAASTITVQLSADATNWYSSAANTGAVTGNFGIDFSPGARHVRLISSAASTITATLQCKAQ